MQGEKARWLMHLVTPRSAFSTKRLVSSSFINVGNNNQKHVFTYILHTVDYSI